jgi:hypothetical protein
MVGSVINQMNSKCKDVYLHIMMDAGSN